MAKIKLEFTNRQLESLISLIETIEALKGCGDDEGTGEVNFDVETAKEIRNLDRMFKKNGFKRKLS